MKVCIVRPGRAFNSEVAAYIAHFKKFGHECVDVGSTSNLAGFDVAILFNGFHPFWKKFPPVVVAEYQSLSTGHFSRGKDLVKRLVNKKGDLYIFLNDYVRKKLFFSTKVRHLYRPMGFFEVPNSHHLPSPEFDLVYAGSVRPGLLTEIERLSSMGLTILLIGDFDGFSVPGVVKTGVVQAEQVPGLIAKARAGLNYVPLKPPYTRQDSTKVVEYCSQGLGVVTNTYSWIKDFFAERGGRYLEVSAISQKSDFLDFPFRVPSVDDLEWENLLSSIGLAQQVFQIYETVLNVGKAEPRG